jgi:hypothetical protein
MCEVEYVLLWIAILAAAAAIAWRFLSARRGRDVA